MDKIITFSSSKFHPTPAERDEESDDYINPGIFGRQLSDYLTAELDKIGVKVTFRCAEDWGWYHEIQHDASYRLGFGCHSNEGEDHLVQFIPKKPYVRNWFRKHHAEPGVSQLRDQIMSILTSDETVSKIQLEDG